jgi:hypothetical protein
LRTLGRDVDVLACRREQAKRQIIGSAAAAAAAAAAAVATATTATTTAKQADS